MLNFLYLLTLLFSISNNKFVFADFHNGNDIDFHVSNNNIVFEDLTKELLFFDANTEIPIEPTLEPTTEVTFTQSKSPIMEPTLEPTLEPTIEPTLEPTLEPVVITEVTNNPTFLPTFINKDSSYKILDFYVDIELINYKSSELKEYDKDILLSSFEIITEVNKEYLSIRSKILKLRKLFVVDIDSKLYTLEESIGFSIPLVDKYKTYDPQPIELYNAIVVLIQDSINYGYFQEIIKYYNSSSFDNIEISLLGISEPTVRSVTATNKNKEDNDNITDYKLTLILVFGILGILLIIFSRVYVFPKIYNYKTATETEKNKNKVYFIIETDLENIETTKTEPQEKEITEESRIVEITNETII